MNYADYLKQKNRINLSEFNFPELSPKQIAFSVVRTDPRLLEEAKAQGFYNSNTPFNDLFNDLFFKGGKLNFKKDIDPKFKERASRYLTAFMQSFAPKHEEKEAICALILSNLVDIEDET